MFFNVFLFSIFQKKKIDRVFDFFMLSKKIHGKPENDKNIKNTDLFIFSIFLFFLIFQKKTEKIKKNEKKNEKILTVSAKKTSP